MADVRLRALRDPHSSYYENVSRIILRAQEDMKRVAERRTRVTIPFKVSAASVAEYERRFGWKVVVENHGLRSAFSPHVAGLVYCMSMRNLLALGRDGEEVVALDPDMPTLVAKGAAYVTAVRTCSSTQLQASYAMEEAQLRRLASSKNSAIVGSAKSVLAELEVGGGARLKLNALGNDIRGDVLLVDHTRTSVSLAQVVATARAWGLASVRGVCFFQPEMLVHNIGPLSAFKGEYVIDEEADLITYIPEENPSTRFSHRWSFLRSFFLNHECVVGGTSWLVEKHLGRDGIFHYVARTAEEPWEFPVELGANYYSACLTEWVELRFPTRGGVAKGANAGYWRRDTARLPKKMYDQVMAVLLAVDVKSLNKEQVLLALRNFNNTSVVAGDTVKVPERVWSEDVQKAAVPMLAQAVYRRAAASAELSKALGVFRKRYGVVNESVLSLTWELMCSGVDFLKSVAVGAIGDEDAATLDALAVAGVDMSVVSKLVPASIEVVQVVGAMEERDCGGFIPQLPTGRSSLVDRMLAKARSYAAARGRKGRTESVVSDVTESCVTGTSSVVASSADSGFSDGQGTEVGREVALTVPVVEVTVESEVDVRARQGVAGRLFDKLVAEQDAVTMVRPPRAVHCYESISRADVVPVPSVPADAALMQDDYDDGMPGVSLVDAEAVPYIATESETSVVRQTYMSLNDAKREIAAPKWIRRAKARGGAAGSLPRTQSGLMAAMGKRNIEVPMNRESVDFGTFPDEVVDRIRDVCYVDNWKEILNRELDTGLWRPNEADLATYVDKVETAKAEAMLKEFFQLADVDMKKWLVMTKAKAKPPVDDAAASKVPLPQTIMYNESKSMNALYSSIMSRFHDTVDSMMLPNVSFNARHSPADHEVWFNSVEPIRRTCSRLYRYQGDSFNFDRSLELAAFSVELCFYRRHGLDAETLHRWKSTMGVKRAVSLMHGLVAYIILQGLSGIFKTLFRNGLVTLACVVVSAKLDRQTLVSLDVKGDDYTVETSRPLDTAEATKTMAWGFNLSAKFFESEYLHFCSKYWVQVDGWWYWVADPDRKFESVCAAVVTNECGEDKLSEKWVSLRDDLRHYDNGLVMLELVKAVFAQGKRSREPLGLVYGLGALAESRDAFFRFYGPAERIGG